MVCQFQQIMTRTFKFESENPWMAISRPSQSLKTNNFLHKSYISKCTCNLAISSENCNLFNLFFCASNFECSASVKAKCGLYKVTTSSDVIRVANFRPI